MKIRGLILNFIRCGFKLLKMKRTTLLTMLILALCGQSQAQIFDRIKNKITEKATQKIDEKIDKAAQKVVDAPEDAIKTSKTEPQKNNKQEAKPTSQQNSIKQAKTNIDYGSFDFIPGQTILFEDEFINESINEIPSLWIPTGGKLEIVKVDGKNVMASLDGDAGAYPRMKKYAYLPKRFTIEYDFLAKHNSGKSTDVAASDGNGYGQTNIYFYSEGKDQATGDFTNRLNISSSGIVEFGNYKGQYTSGQKAESGWTYEDLHNKWIHVSVAVNERNVKVYINSQRVLNAPINEGNAVSIALYGTGTDYEMGFKTFIRNVRIAGGLKDPYKQGTSEIPKLYIARGIKFDYNQATLKPESMGEIKNVVAMLTDHPETKYEIGGHTDSDGDDKYNLTLSQQRADAVKAKLVELGISSNRLTAKGYGEGKPVTVNTSPEGKANNRRVEFTLITK